MWIKVIFDSDTLDKNLYTGWGVSFLVDYKVLFDTGEKGFWLLENMKYLNVDIGTMEAVVISHDHWDHTGGLWEVLKRRKGLKVYACPHFSQEFKDKVKTLRGTLIESGKFAEIAKNIFITGEIPGVYKGEYLPEQALVVKTKNGITVVAGCSHPGIVKILEKVKEKFPQDKLYFVFGGFHLKDSSKGKINSIAEKFKQMNVEKAGPTHCSGRYAEEIFRERYGKNFISIKTGQIFKI
jgi:7,8-dihydropterin-6-yl-methyl-4-(beta-D-ribofuranosyl)aminobenzene 5'-phosphate synthase